MFTFDDCSIDCERRELRRGADLIGVEPQVFDVLVYLIRNRDRVVSRDDLLASVWSGRIVSESTLASRINAARTAIGDSGVQQRLIRTIARKGFRFVGQVREASHSAAASAPHQPALPRDMKPTASTGAPARPLLERSSIAVLPFINMSGDPEQEYLADGIAEEVIAALSKWRWFLVIARNSTFAFKGGSVSTKQIGEELGARYVVEGSVRRAGTRVRITAQLIEAETGRHIWADRYDRDIGDLFVLQDEIAQHVVVAVDPAIRVSEVDHAKRKPPGRMDAWDHFLRGSYHFHFGSRRETPAALEHLQRAIEIDPHFGPAHARLAMTHTYAASVGWAADYRNTMRTAVNAARTAIALDPFDSSAHAAASGALTFMRQHDAAVEAGRRAVDLNSNYDVGYFMLGIALTLGGEVVEALSAFESAVRLSPRDRAAWGLHTWRALAHYTARQYDAAHGAADRALVDRPGFGGAKVTKAAALVRLGRVLEAKKMLSDVPIIIFSQMPCAVPFRNPANLEHVLVALEKAGLSRTISKEVRRRFAELDVQLEQFR